MATLFKLSGDFKYYAGISLVFALFSSLVAGTPGPSLNEPSGLTTTTRERISINQDWRFFKYDSASMADDLIYDVRPQFATFADFQPADAKPTEQLAVETTGKTLKAWILPTGNAFIKDPEKRFNGLALVIVQSEEGKTGSITVKDRAPGLKGAVVKLVSK